MAITIKKSTLSLKKSDENLTAHAPTAPHVTHGPVLSSVSERGPAWTLYAIAGLIGVLFMVGVVLLQYLEYAHYKDAFPLRVPQAVAVTASKPAVEAPRAKAPAEKAAEPAAEKAAEPAAETSPPAPAPAPAPAPTSAAVEE